MIQNYKDCQRIPANFFRVIGMRFLSSWECGDFKDNTNTSEDSQRCPKSSKDSRSRNSPYISQSESQSQCFLFEKGRIISLRVIIFLEIMSSKAATTHIFQSGVRIFWPISVSRHEIEVFSPQAWDLCLRCESWQVSTHVSSFLRIGICYSDQRSYTSNLSYQWSKHIICVLI